MDVLITSLETAGSGLEVLPTASGRGQATCAAPFCDLEAQPRKRQQAWRPFHYAGVTDPGSGKEAKRESVTGNPFRPGSKLPQEDVHRHDGIHES